MLKYKQANIKETDIVIFSIAAEDRLPNKPVYTMDVFVCVRIPSSVCGSVFVYM